MNHMFFNGIFSSPPHSSHTSKAISTKLLRQRPHLVLVCTMYSFLFNLYIDSTLLTHSWKANSLTYFFSNYKKVKQGLKKLIASAPFKVWHAVIVRRKSILHLSKQTIWQLCDTNSKQFVFNKVKVNFIKRKKKKV